MAEQPLIDISPENWRIVRDILQRYVPDREVWAFGSRAKWTAKEFSDLDIAIICDEPLSISLMADIREAFQESALPFKIDIVDWAAITPSFRKVIETAKVKLQEGSLDLRQWPTVRLGDLISVKHGFAFKSEFFCDEPRLHQLITPGNFAIGGGFQFGKGKYYSGPVPQDYVLHKGDVVITMTDLSRSGDTLGYAAVIPETEGTIWLHNQRVGLVEVKKNAPVVLGYLHYLLRSSSYRHHVVATASGSTVKHTAPSRICDFCFSLPSVSEQIAIAEVLSSLDERITLLRETNLTLESFAQALFKSWFIDFDPVRAKAEGSKPEGVPPEVVGLFPSKFEDSEIGEIPKGWTTKPVYDLAEYINGAAYKAFSPNGEKQGLPIIKIAELKAGITPQTAYSDVSMPDKYLLETGDILLSWSGNPDTSIDTFIWHHGRAWLNQHIFRVLVQQASERPFVLQTLKYLRPVFAETARNKQTTGLGHFTVADMKRLLVVQPSEPVLLAFGDMVAPIHARIFENEQQAITLTSLRDRLLPTLMSGNIAVVGDMVE